jgi:gas vesicle protein
LHIEGFQEAVMARRYEDQPVVVIEKSGGGVGAFVAGAAVGAILALLFAPQTGEETRADIRRRAQRLREAAEDRLDDLQEAVESGYARTKASIEASLQKARHSIDERRGEARDTVDAGKAAVRTARDELERRLADARSQRRATADAEADE